MDETALQTRLLIGQSRFELPPVISRSQAVHKKISTKKSKQQNQQQQHKKERNLES